MANKPKINSNINGYDYFRVRTLIGYDDEGKPKYKNFYGTSKNDAEKQKRYYLNDISKGLNPDLAKESLSKAMSTWLWEIEHHNGNKNSSFERYESIYRIYVKDSALGLLPVSEIKKIAVQKHYNSLLKDGKSYSQIKNLNKLLNKFFNYAETDDYIIKNPLKGLKIPKETEDEIKETAKKIETFSDDEIKILFESLGNEKLRYIIDFALNTGAREAEILAAETADIINDATILKISKSIRNVKMFDDNKKGKYELKVTKPKTKSSIRDVPINTKLKESLKNLKELITEEKIHLGEAYTENNLLFPSLTGSYIDSRNLIRSWNRALNNAGIPYKKFHALRHTYATKLIANGIDIVTLSHLLGHSSVKITEIYLHPLDNISDDNLKKLESIF